MGPPGSGKTSIGKRLAARLNYKWIDVDDHVLEPEWNCTVGEKLFQLGEKLFLQVIGVFLENYSSNDSQFQNKTNIFMTMVFENVLL